MTHGMMIQRRVIVPVPPREAFRAFTSEFASWWPAEYSWSGDVLEHIGMEPSQGGHCFEIGPRGFRCDWGTVLLWAPPGLLRFAWQVGLAREPIPNLSHASEVEVQFSPTTDRQTIVDLEHRGFARHGRDGQAYWEAFDAPMGWTYVLDRYSYWLVSRVSAAAV